MIEFLLVNHNFCINGFKYIRIGVQNEFIYLFIDFTPQFTQLALYYFKMSDSSKSVHGYFEVLPPLSQCQTLSRSQIRDVCKMFETLPTIVDDKLEELSSSLAAGSDIRATKLDNLRDRSVYLSGIERNFKLEWNETNIENPSILINAVSSVWLAGKKLVTVREELHSTISIFCPPACLMTTQELDRVWEEDYTSLDAEIASICTSESHVCTSISKDTLVNWSDKWVDILTEKFRNKTFSLQDRAAFDPFLFIAVKLHSLTGRLITKCVQLHATSAPRALPALKSILHMCPAILGNFSVIQDLIGKKPVCTILQDANPAYAPGSNEIDELRKKAKEFQTQYASLSDDVERYLSICRYTKLRENYDEILLIDPHEDFDLNNFEESLTSIQDIWDLGLEQNLLLYVLQLDFLSICDKFQNELSLGIEFLCKYECTKYQDIDIMNEHKKSIHNFIFSSHWIDSRQQEKTKLIECIKQINSSISDEEELEIFSIKTAMRLVQIIETDFEDFTNLYENVIEYYDQGIEKWKEFLEEVKDFDDNLSSKSFLLTNGFIKFQDASKFPDSVKKLRIDSAELEKFSEVHAKLMNLGDQLCVFCEGGCQEFIQSKLAFLCEHIEDMRTRASDIYNEVEPLVATIIGLDENIAKIEEVLSETEEKVFSNGEEYSKAKAEVFMNYLKSRICSLKKRTAKLGYGRSQLDPLLNIEALNLTFILIRYQEAEKKLNKILQFLSEKLETVVNSILEKTRSKLLFSESNLDSYDKFFQSLQDENFSENKNDVTKRLHELEQFFNNDFIEEIQSSIDDLSECSKELIADDVTDELIGLEESLNKLEITIRSTKILMHFAITFRELHEVLKLRESFLQNSDKPCYMAEKIGFISIQIEALFGEDFKICQMYYKQLRTRYNEYLSDENQPPVLPLSLEIVSRLESRMRERLEALETSFIYFNTIFRDVERCINQFRVNSQNMLTFADKLEVAFTHKENTTIRDSSVLEMQCNTWELLLLEGQNFLTQYDNSFEDAFAIYENLSPSPKVVFVKNLFPKANEYLEQLKSTLNLYQTYQTDLKLNEDRLSNLTSNFSHFYTEMRFPSISINGTGIDKHIQRCEEFRNELQAIKNAVRRLRIGIPELQAGSHEIVEYSIIEEDRLKMLEDKLPEWQFKVDGLSNECQNSVSISNSNYEPQLTDERMTEHSSFEFISQDSDPDSGAFHLSTGPVQIPSEQCQRIQEKLTKIKRWLKRKEKAHIMTSDISIKLSEAQLQKSEIDVTKLEFEKKRDDFKNILTDSGTNFPAKLDNYYKEVELLFRQFEIAMAKRCEKASNRVSSLLELHLLISLCEKSLDSVKTSSSIALEKQYTLQQQIQKFTELRNELRDCEQDCIAKIREHFTELTRDSATYFPNLESSPETSVDSLSESDTEEKLSKPSESLPINLTSLLLPAIPCREQIQAIEANHKELFSALTEQINSLTERRENANLISNRLQSINERAVSLIQTISDQTASYLSTHTLDTLVAEYSSLESEYTSMQLHYTPDGEALRLQLNAREAIRNLQGVVNEKRASVQEHDPQFDSPLPFDISEYVLETNPGHTSLLLDPDDIPPLVPSQEEEHHLTEPILERCFAVISDCYEFYKQFSSAGPHLEISGQVFTNDVQSKYTDCHTEVMSLFVSSNVDPTGFVNEKVHGWLQVLKTVCEILKNKIKSGIAEWQQHVESYNSLYGYINELQSELEDFQTQTIEDEIEYQIALETTLRYLSDSIEGYNGFSPRMYQLITCESCEDGSCQEWYQKLNNCRDKLISFKDQFASLTQRKAAVPDLTEQMDSIAPAVLNNDISPIDEPATETVETVSLPSPKNNLTLEFAKSLSIAPTEMISKSHRDPIPLPRLIFSYLSYFFLTTTLVYGLLTMKYISFVSNNPPNLPK